MCEPHRLLCAPHFGKLSEFAKVLSFGASRTGFTYSAVPARRLSFAHPSLILRPCWRELVARAYHNSLYNQCASHFGKLSEFAKVLSFGASRTGFYATHTLANFQSLTKFYPSVRAAQAFIYLNEQSVLRPVQLGTQCVPNWIHSIELPTKF